MAFERRNDPDRLSVMVEPAIGRHQRIERFFAGMAEGRMAEIMRERYRLGQFGVEPERARDRPRHLRNLDGMGEAGAEIVALMLDEDLRLVLEAAEGAGMDDTVPVALEGRAEGALFLGPEAAARPRGV